MEARARGEGGCSVIVSVAAQSFTSLGEWAC